MYLFAVAEINSHCSQIPTLKHDHKINCKISGISCLYAPLYVDCNGARCYHAMHDATTAHIIHCHPHPHIRKADPLILLQLRVLLLDAVLGDDEHLQAITNLNMPLRRAGERIRYECLDRRSVQQLGLPHHLLQTSAGVGVVLVLEVDLVVQERCDQTARSTSSTARLALVAAHGIVRVQSAHAVLVLDGAGWHGLAALGEVPRNLTLLPLPPYSPELNPVENVWEYLRQNQLSLRVWPDYAAIVATCCEAWNALIAAPERIASITRREWARAVGN